MVCSHVLGQMRIKTRECPYYEWWVSCWQNALCLWSFADLKICAKDYFSIGCQESDHSTRKNWTSWSLAGSMTQTSLFRCHWKRKLWWCMCSVTTFEFSYSTVWNILQKMVHCFLYKISRNQQVEATDLCTDFSCYNWRGCIAAMADSVDQLKPISTSEEYWTPIIAAFGM